MRRMLRNLPNLHESAPMQGEQYVEFGLDLWATLYKYMPIHVRIFVSWIIFSFILIF